MELHAASLLQLNSSQVFFKRSPKITKVPIFRTCPSGCFVRVIKTADGVTGVFNESFQVIIQFHNDKDLRKFVTSEKHEPFLKRVLRKFDNFHGGI